MGHASRMGSRFGIQGDHPVTGLDRQSTPVEADFKRAKQQPSSSIGFGDDRQGAVRAIETDFVELQFQCGQIPIDFAGWRERSDLRQHLVREATKLHLERSQRRKRNHAGAAARPAASRGVRPGGYCAPAPRSVANVRPAARPAAHVGGGFPAARGWRQPAVRSGLWT